MYDLIIRDATVVAGSGRRVADVAVEGGRVAYIGANPGGPGRDEIDATGAFLMPGVIDTHVHFRDPGAPQKEDFGSGSAAALSGGVTSVMDMPNTAPETVSLERFQAKAEMAAAKSHCHWGLWSGTNGDNGDELLRMRDAGSVATKIFMGSSTGPLLCDAAAMREVFSIDNLGLIGVHAEDEEVLVRTKAQMRHIECPHHHEVRPVEAAIVAVQALVDLVGEFERRVHICHLSTAAELELLRGTNPGGNITVEACPHHLHLSVESTGHLGNLGRCNPPIRPESDRAALWDALIRGEIDTIGSDHAPHTLEEKEGSYWSAPSGVPGVETSLPLMLGAAARGEISYERLAATMCEAPARIFGVQGKGRIEVGFDADMLLIREGLQRSLTTEGILSRCGWSPFEGMKMAEKPERVMMMGRTVAMNGEITDGENRGDMLRVAR